MTSRELSYQRSANEIAAGKRPEQDQPANLDRLPDGLAHVIQRRLDMEHEQRWQSALDIRAELDWLAKPKAPAPVPPLVRGAAGKWIWMAVAVSLGLIVGAFRVRLLHAQVADMPVVRFTLAGFKDEHHLWIQLLNAQTVGQRWPTSDRPTNQGRQIRFLARSMAGVSLGISIRTTQDLLAKTGKERLQKIYRPACDCGHQEQDHKDHSHRSPIRLGMWWGYLR